MRKYREIKGNLITLAKAGEFDVIAHGVNCSSTMGAGIAPQMAKTFRCDNYPMELDTRNPVNKLGCIDYRTWSQQTWLKYSLSGSVIRKSLRVVNAYTQFHYGKNHVDGVEKPVDYHAILMCFKKMNYLFKGMHIGLPQIGCGLGGGDWRVVKKLIQKYLCDCQVTVVIYDQT